MQYTITSEDSILCTCEGAYNLLEQIKSYLEMDKEDNINFVYHIKAENDAQISISRKGGLTSYKLWDLEEWILKEGSTQKEKLTMIYDLIDKIVSYHNKNLRQWQYYDLDKARGILGHLIYNLKE